MQTDFPKLALGTWLMGGTKDPDPKNDDQKDLAAIKTALDFGISLIDTAQNYANGRCEELVGLATADYPRDSYQILTKQNRVHLGYDQVMSGFYDSLNRLNLEYIDYFLCHAPNPDFDLKEFFKATNQLHKEGLIRHVGVSNFGPTSLQIALETSEPPIAVNQVSFSLNDSGILTSGTYDLCLENKIPIQAYRTLADIAEDPEIYSILETLSKKYALTPHQIALAYLNSHEGMCFTIKASSSDHWQQIKDALTISLEPADTEQLKKIHLTKKSGFSNFLEM